MSENDTQTTAGDTTRKGGCRSWIYGGKPWEAFKTFALIFSFIVNIVFFIVLLAIAPLILPIVNEIVNPLVSGLNQSFVDMGEATIIRTIKVDDELPISFTLPLDTYTNVVVTQGVPLEKVPAQFILPNGGGYINGSVSLTLPEGLELPVQLSLEVPVEQTIPVQLDVAVDIPLDETELGKPFTDLQEIFGPLHDTLSGLPEDNEDLFNRLLTAPPEAKEAVPEESVKN
ncbi:MAG: hypothetical protein CSA11_07500 [Chloroflexi bacterium]|nr:MAG: hypothetical protein CSA11_07500 [Chloroflexota bacterium]